MDWNSLKQKITPYIAKADPYIKTVGSYTQKAAVFAEGQIQTTPLFIKNQAEYDDLLIAKRTVIIAYNEMDPVAQQIRIFSPIWIARAFMDNATLRFISLSECHDLANSLGFGGPLDMRVRFEGRETMRFQTIDDIRTWWKKPFYKNEETTGDSPAASPVDPLANHL